MARQNSIGKTATTISAADGYTIVTYHQTQVVKVNDAKIILNSGGWRTNTTKTRMNQTANQFGLGFQVYQKDFEWFVDFNGKVHEFTDNMVLDR